MTWLRCQDAALEAIRRRTVERQEAVINVMSHQPARLPEVCRRLDLQGWDMGERTVRRYLGMLCDAGKLEKYEGMYRRKR